MKEKPVSFKINDKQIARKKIIELEVEIKAKIITKTRESKLEVSREIIEKKSRDLKQIEKLKEKK